MAWALFCYLVYSTILKISSEKINPTLRHKLLASKTQSPLDSVKPLINFVATEKLYKKITQKNCAPVLTLDSLLCTKTCAYRFILEFRQRK